MYWEMCFIQSLIKKIVVGNDRIGDQIESLLETTLWARAFSLNCTFYSKCGLHLSLIKEEIATTFKFTMFIPIGYKW